MYGLNAQNKQRKKGRRADPFPVETRKKANQKSRRSELVAAATVAVAVTTALRG